MGMASCKECVHSEMCFLTHIDGSPACCEYKDRNNLVEVVRCKDCKWAEYGKDYEPYCNHWKSGLYANIKDDDFCSYGERKDNG